MFLTTERGGLEEAIDVHLALEIPKTRREVIAMSHSLVFLTIDITTRRTGCEN